MIKYDFTWRSINLKCHLSRFLLGRRGECGGVVGWEGGSDGAWKAPQWPKKVWEPLALKYEIVLRLEQKTKYLLTTLKYWIYLREKPFIFKLIPLFQSQWCKYLPQIKRGKKWLNFFFFQIISRFPPLLEALSSIEHVNISQQVLILHHKRWLMCWLG